MGVGAGLYVYDVVVRKFTFTISSPGEFLFSGCRYMPCSFSRQAYVMLLLLSFFLLTIAWSQEILETTRPIFTTFAGLVDMFVLMFSLVLVTRSVKGRYYGNRF